MTDEKPPYDPDQTDSTSDSETYQDKTDQFQPTSPVDDSPGSIHGQQTDDDQSSDRVRYDFMAGLTPGDEGADTPASPSSDTSSEDTQANEDANIDRSFDRYESFSLEQPETEEEPPLSETNEPDVEEEVQAPNDQQESGHRKKSKLTDFIFYGLIAAAGGYMVYTAYQNLAPKFFTSDTGPQIERLQGEAALDVDPSVQQFKQTMSGENLQSETIEETDMPAQEGLLFGDMSSLDAADVQEEASTMVENAPELDEFANSLTVPDEIEDDLDQVVEDTTDIIDPMDDQQKSEVVVEENQDATLEPDEMMQEDMAQEDVAETSMADDMAVQEIQTDMPQTDNVAVEETETTEMQQDQEMPEQVKEPVEVEQTEQQPTAEDAAETTSEIPMSSESVESDSMVEDVQEASDQEMQVTSSPETATVQEQLQQIMKLTQTMLKEQDQLEQRVGELTKRQSELEEMAEQSDRPMQVQSVAKPKLVKKAAQPKSKPKPVRAEDIQWKLRAATPDQAWLSSSKDQAFRRVGVGDRIAGLGRITGIRQENGLWVVIGTEGRVAQK